MFAVEIRALMVCFLLFSCTRRSNADVPEPRASRSEDGDARANAASSEDSGDGETGGAAQAPGALCDGSLWRLEFPERANPDEGAVATLILEHSSETADFFRPGREAPGTCVRFKDGPWSILPQGTRLEVPASSEGLQRWRVGGAEVLLLVLPEEELRFVDEDHTVWRLRGPRFDPPPGLMCQTPKSCSKGEEARAWSGCEDGKSVCVTQPRLRFTDPDGHRSGAWDQPKRARKIVLDEVEVGEVFWGRSDMRSLVRVASGTHSQDITALLMGVGERWEIWLDADDRLSGRSLP